MTKGPSRLEVSALEPPGDDLAWTAFRYVAGELDHAAASAFEARLDVDQSAREAVAGAVELVAAVARSAPAGRARSRPARRAALIVSSTAAMLLILLAPWSRWVGPGVSIGTGEVPRTTAEALALTWSGLWQSGETAAEPEIGTDATLDLLVQHQSPADDPEAPALDEPADPPGWLVEAAALETSRSSGL